MTRRITAVAILSLLLLAFLGTSVFAAKEAPPRRVIDPAIYKVMQYSFPIPEDPANPSIAPRVQPRQQLGTSAPSASPGAAVGVTWYDYQHNGTMGRQNETRTGVSTIAHFSWMYLPGRVITESRGGYYNNYNISLQAFGTAVKVVPDDHYAGYVNIDVTNDNRAVLGMHNREPSDGKYDPQFYFDFAEGASFFGASYQTTRAMAEYGTVAGDEYTWPKFAYSEGVSDTVLHVIAQENGGAITYFRRPYSDNNIAGTWDYPPRIVDTVQDVSQALDANDNGKVVLGWTANIKCAAGDPDTASCNAGVSPSQWNNDVYYQISNNFGVTWQPRVNITKNFGKAGTDHYQPYTDIGLLIDLAGNVHVVWGSPFWSAGGDIYLRNRIFHYSENQPYIRVAAAADWDQTTCNGGAWNLNMAKMSISECNGRFYVLFTQFNDGKAGIFTDCADDGNPGFPSGGANGELYVVVSEDGGLTWDQARNLTNSRTPGCDSVGGAGGPCESDHWSTMARFGTNVALQPGDNVTDVVVPAGGSNTGWWLDVQYINDHSAGGIVQGEGTWQESDVRWFRLACVAAVTAPNPAWAPANIAFPAWTKMNRPLNKSVVIENLGNAAYTYAVAKVEDPSVPAGISSGWLTYSNFSGSVPFGVSNTETGTVTITPTGGLTTGIYNLKGRLIFTGNNSTSPDTFEIAVVVADTVYPAEVDTIKTPALSLAVNNGAAMGEQGAGKVNMDYVNPTNLTYKDCDTTKTVYMYSGSPVITYLKGADTVGNWSSFGMSYAQPVGFFYLSNAENADSAGCDMYKAVQLTRDSTLAMQTTFFAPKTGTGDSVNFIIKRLRIYPKDGLAHNDISIGEAIDWDIPSDSASDNGSDFDATAKMIWQYGGEYHQDDTGAHPACQDNDARFGGIKLLAMKKGATDLTATAPVNAFTGDNPTWVYNNDYGWVVGEMFTRMETMSGYSKYESTNPDSALTDLHTVMTFTNSMNFAANDTVTIWMALITVRNGTQTDFINSGAKALKWYQNHLIPVVSDCILRGDMQCDNKVIVSDLTYLVNFLFKGGPAPCKVKHGDVNCDNKTIVSDLTYLVNFLFKGGPAPCACS